MPGSPRGDIGTVCLGRPAQQQSMSRLDLEELAEIGKSMFSFQPRPARSLAYICFQKIIYIRRSKSLTL